MLNKELDPYNSHKNNYQYNKEVVLLRVLDGNYYKENRILYLNSWGIDEVQLFAKHIFWKNFLKNIKNGTNLKYSKQIVSEIQTSYDLNTCNFGEENTDVIVPKDQTHDYLLKEFNIDKKIKDYYFEPSIKLQDSKSILYLNKEFKNDWKHILTPYSNIFLNSYHKRNNLFYSLISISTNSNYSPKINNKPIETLFDLKPYFTDYSKGFKYGYDNFEIEKVKKYLNEYSTKEDYLNKVFEFITNHNLDKGWLSSHGFTTNGLDNKNIINGFENGQIEGYYYKAWCLVFSSSNQYKPLFKNYFWNSKKVEICHKLIGRTNGENTPNTSQPAYHHIKDILKHYDLKPMKAKEMLNDIKGFVSKDWNTHVIPFVLDYLESIKKWKPQQSEKFKSNDRNLLKKDLEKQNEEITGLTFNDSIINDLFNVLKINFSTEHQKQLKLLLNNKETNSKLFFTNSGNKLSDAFKQLYESNLIGNCTKKELQEWVCDKFTFKNRGKSKDFKPRTVQDVISNKESKSPCKHPLFKIEQGNIIKL